MPGRALGALVLLAVFVALGAFVYFSEIRPEQEAATASPSPSPRDVFPVEGQTFDRLSVQGQGAGWVAERTDSGWQIVEPQVGPGRTDVIEDRLNSLTGLRAFRVLDEEGLDLSEYGLDDPQLTVEFTSTEGEEFALQFGGTTPDERSRYAKKIGESPVYLVLNDTYQVFAGLVDNPPYLDGSPTAPSPAPPAGQN